MNYHELLIKYMMTVLWEEGISFADRAYDLPEDEKAELMRIEQEAIERLRNQTV